MTDLPYPFIYLKPQKGKENPDVFSERLTSVLNFSGIVWTGHECLQFQGCHSKLMLTSYMIACKFNNTKFSLKMRQKKKNYLKT